MRAQLLDLPPITRFVEKYKSGVCGLVDHLNYGAPRKPRGLVAGDSGDSREVKHSIPTRMRLELTGAVSDESWCRNKRL